MIKAFRHSDDKDELVANTYVLGKDGKSCLIVDMGDTGDAIVSYVRSHFKSVSAVLLTHAHIDHFRGVDKFLASFPDKKIPVYLEELDYPTLFDKNLNCAEMQNEKGNFSFDPVLTKDGEVLSFGELKIKVIHTPFHTPGSCCYLSEEDNALFTGDTLFKGSIGRSDLPGGDDNSIVPSLFKLRKLSDLLVCYPGHGQVTTLGDEKKTNPFFR